MTSESPDRLRIGDAYSARNALCRVGQGTPRLSRFAQKRSLTYPVTLDLAHCGRRITIRFKPAFAAMTSVPDCRTRRPRMEMLFAQHTPLFVNKPP